MKTILAFGLSAAVALALPADVQAQCATSGSTFTTLAGGNGQQGTMFDITPSVGMSIECVDFLHSNSTDLVDVEIWYCTAGSSFGNEGIPGNWALLGSGTALAPDPLTNIVTVDVSGNGVPFNPGQDYGIYVYEVNYPTIGGFLSYTTNTAGPTVYPGTHCDITSNAGVPGFFAGTFQTRDFNGEVHTELLSGSPVLNITQGLPGGLMDFSGFLFTPSAGAALVYGPAAQFTVPGGPCAGTVLDLQPVNASNPIIVPTDINGALFYTQYVPPQGAGKWVQAVDVTSCDASNAVQL